MEQKKIYCDPVLDQVPPLSPKYPRFVAQNTEDEGDGTGDHIFYTIDKPSYCYRCRIPELIGRQIRPCFQGWLILSDHPHDLLWSLWNPLTSTLIHLPPLQEKFIYECCLSSPPDDPSSIFLLTTFQKPTIILCPPDSKRNKLKWTEVSYREQLRNIVDEDGFLHCATSCNGKVYALHNIYSEDLVIHIDIVIKETEVVITLEPFVEVPNPSFTVCPSFDRHRHDTTFVFLKASSTDQLLYVIIDFGDETKKIVSDVYLFTLDMDSMTWYEMNDLKDAIIFIELAVDYSISYTSGIASELGGYIHIVDDTGKVIYSYCIKERTISQSSLSSIVGTSKVSPWAMLECRFKGDYGEAKCIADTKQEDGDKGTKIVARSVAFDEVKYHSTMDESRLLNLPFPILETIMEFCVGVEYMNFHATCKLCQLAAPWIQWSNKTASNRLQNYSLVSPWLMVLDRKQITFTDPISGYKYFLKTPEKLSGDLRILCSRFGWLLMFMPAGSLVFFNPFTSDIRELPEAPCLENCYFTAPPTSPDCMVVGFMCSSASEVYIHYVVQERHGRIVNVNIGGHNPYSIISSIYDSGNLYVLGNKGELYVLKNLGVENNSSESAVAKTRRVSRSVAPHFLVKCDQHLLLVSVGKYGKSVEVFKLNDSTKEWLKVVSLGKYSIFICDTTCVCIETNIQDMKNKIYFPRFHLDDKYILFYSLKTGTYNTCVCIETNIQDMKNKIYFPRFHLDDKYILFYSLKTGTYNTFSGNIKESLSDLLGTAHHRHPHAWIQPSWA